MLFMRRKKYQDAIAEEETYVDLGEMYGYDSDKGMSLPASMYIKVADLERYEDLKEYSNYIYNGNILILDFSGISNDEFAMRRVSNELKQLTKDINGDIAAMGKNYLLVTPTGVKVDRRKIRTTTQ